MQTCDFDESGIDPSPSVHGLISSTEPPLRRLDYTYFRSSHAQFSLDIRLEVTSLYLQ